MAPRRELKVVISGDPSSLNKAFAKAGAGANALEARVGKVSSGIGRSLATAAKVGTIAIGGGLVAALKGSVDAFSEAQQVATQTNAVLKSTGSAANVTAKQVSDLATAISKKSGIDDEAVQASENLLLTFRAVRNETGKGNDIFDQATKSVADMATALSHGAVPSLEQLHSSSILVGKALNDPVKGMSAMQRVGVSFTESQKEQVKALEDSGRHLDAQKLILRELRKEFAGSAEAAGNTFAGKISKAKVAVGNLGEAIGGALAPALGMAADKLAGFVDKLASSDRPARFFAGIKGHVDDAKQMFSNLFDDISKNRSGGASLGASIGASLADAVSKINWKEIGDRISKGLSGAVRVSGDISKNVADGLSEAFGRVNGRQVLGKLLDVIGEALDALFSPSFWVQHFAAIFSVVTFVIPVGKILKIPGFSTLYRFISGPIFKAAGAVGSGLVALLGRAGSRAFTSFLVEIERFAPRVANAMLKISTGGANALRSFPGKVAAWAGRTVGALVDRLGDAVGRVAGVMARAVSGGVKEIGQSVAMFARAAGRVVVAIMGRLDDLVGNVPSKIAKALAAGTAKIASWAGNFASAAVRIGKALVDGIVRGIRSAPGKIKGAITGLIGGIASKINPFGEGIGREVGKQAMSGGLGAQTIPGGGAVGGSLMGANASLAPFAAIGARFGLHVSSGRRPGSITSSGNISYHSSGEAIDLADGRGPDAQKMSFFKYMKSHFGARLAELIYTPGGLGVKDGRPFRYTGAVAAQHFDHVHVAFDTGKPGVGDGKGRRRFSGDGLGKFLATSYGPPWGGIQGGGVTATGVNLKGNPHMYGIAVDPSRLKLGSSYYVWPNPFGYRGKFRAFDTGGAIKGNRIDFYDWRGRKAQYGWGAKQVQVSTTPFGGGGSRSSRRTSGSSASTGGGSTATPDTTSPFDLDIAGADIAIAEAEAAPDTVKLGHGLSARTVSRATMQIGALTTKQGVINDRIKKVRKALKKHLRPATRLRLRQELADLLGQRTDLAGQIADLRKPPDATDTTGAGGDAGAGDTGSTEDPNQALIDSNNALAEQIAAAAQVEQEHTQALKDVQDALNAQTAFAQSATSTSNAQAWKALADIMSGQIGGLAVARAFTAGSGVEYAF